MPVQGGFGNATHLTFTQITKSKPIMDQVQYARMAAEQGRPRLGPALRGRRSDAEIQARAAAAGVTVAALSSYYVNPEGAGSQGLLLGYAAVEEDEIETAARRLARALEESIGG